MLSRVGAASSTRSLLLKSNTTSVRYLKTLSNKRTIDKSKLTGGVKVKKDVSKDKKTSFTANGGGSTTSPPSKSSDNSPLLITGAAFVIASGVTAYLYSQKDDDETSTVVDEKAETTETKQKEIKEENVEVVVVEGKEEKKEEGIETKTAQVVEEKVEETKTSKSDSPGVTLEAMCDLGVKGRPATEVVAILPLAEHEVSGNRVSLSAAPSSSQEEKEDKSNLLDAATELAQTLQTTTLNQSHASIQKALSLLRADVDQSYLCDIDNISPSDLKIRLIQLSSELTERARFEALRTKEVLALQDKEISQKYLEILQKQKLEYEDILARRIRQQEDDLARANNALLQQKDDSIQALLQANTSALEQEHTLQLSSTIEQEKLKIEQKYQIQYEEQLSNAKDAFQNQLKALADSMEDLQGRSDALQDKVKLNQTFQLDSVKAHSICAAALTLMNKLSEDKKVNVLVEVQALQALMDKDSVLASALSALPKSVLTKGVPSLSELQVRFDHVHASARQAAMVPEGKYDLFSQIFGIVFAKVTIPPSPSFMSLPTTDNDNNNRASTTIDYTLSNAYHYIQLGHLEQALEQLNTINTSNQASFTIKDWKQDAEDRVAIEKVRKIIQLECAILNATMSGTSSSNA